MDEQIKSNLALEIAQLSLDKATLTAQLAQQQQVNQELAQKAAELEALLDQQTQPKNEEVTE
ncbi:hypothetical protein AB6M97_10210 [Streptococcus hillyeri]|uniref:Phage protein n=1 Tax=Streptococcus hillyeri TaxID=2282420 RepID=A0A3L9DTS6_9STRE|nr:hypothetical protein [Streptococcus hillyeri]RLY03069.1 hypothetical protein EAF07_05885 [Streptococcus hillyeri]